MKIVIDIPEDVLKRTVFYREFRDLNDCVTTIKALENGIPIPDNATNGDVIKMMFMPNQITRTGDDTVHMEYDFTPEWWNAPYQKGGKE